MYFVDSHCHLEFKEFAGKTQELIDLAAQEGIKTLLTIGTGIGSTDALVELAETFPEVYATVGIHPHEAATLSSRGDLETFLERYVHHPRMVGIGETGLDFYYDHSPREIQEQVFKVHLDKAIEMELPVVVHTREAEEETVRILKEATAKGVKGVIHCFTGSQWLADEVLDLGFYISCSGVLTFKNAESLRETIAGVPLDRLLIETDSPYLAPIPHRGGTNQPAYVVRVAEKVAELKGISLEDVATATTQNFFDLFSKAKPTPA